MTTVYYILSYKMTVGGVNLNLSDPPAATDSPSQNTERYYRPLKPNEIKKKIYLIMNSEEVYSKVILTISSFPKKE